MKKYKQITEKAYEFKVFMNFCITSMMSDDSASRDPMPVSLSFLGSGSQSESDSDSLLGDGGLGGGRITPASRSLRISE